MPGARWKPAYDLHFASARGQIRVETAAVVEQATGEDWTDATLLLSTAMPGRGIDLPELLTWTLGERSEFVPQLRRAPAAGRRAAPAVPGACRPPRTRARAIDAEMVRARLAQASSADGRSDRDSIDSPASPTREARRSRRPRTSAPVPARRGVRAAALRAERPRREWPRPRRRWRRLRRAARAATDAPNRRRPRGGAESRDRAETRPLGGGARLVRRKKLGQRGRS